MREPAGPSSGLRPASPPSLPLTPPGQSLTGAASAGGRCRCSRSYPAACARYPSEEDTDITIPRPRGWPGPPHNIAARSLPGLSKRLPRHPARLPIVARGLHSPSTACWLLRDMGASMSRSWDSIIGYLQELAGGIERRLIRTIPWLVCHRGLRNCGCRRLARFRTNPDAVASRRSLPVARRRARYTRRADSGRRVGASGG